MNPRWIPILRQLARRRPVLLGFHGVSDATPRQDLHRLQLSSGRFRRLLSSMLAAGFRFTTVAGFVGEGGPGTAVVTFDDGMRNNLTVAAPILAELGIPATVFVTTGSLGGHSPWIGPQGDGAMLSEREVRELATLGWEIGAHTVTHPDMSKLDAATCRHEAEASARILAELTDRPVTTFAYPFGRYGPAAVRAVREAGFAAAVTTGSGVWEPFELTRAMVSAGDPDAILMLKMLDRYEPILASAAGRGARAAVDALRATARSVR